MHFTILFQSSWKPQLASLTKIEGPPFNPSKHNAGMFVGVSRGPIVIPHDGSRNGGLPDGCTHDGILPDVSQKCVPVPM